VAILLVAITAAFGRAAYDADIPTGATLLRFLVALLVGAAAFCALGLAATALIPNADAAAPVVNAIILPLEFLSGIFIAFGNTTPAWILWVARVFPVRHFVLSMQAGFLGSPFSWTDVLVVAAWASPACCWPSGSSAGNRARPEHGSLVPVYAGLWRVGGENRERWT